MPIAPLLYGALPHPTLDAALSVLHRFAMPYIVWPQLPQRSFRERSVVQAAYGFPGVVIDEQQRRVFVQRAVSESAIPQLALDFLQRRDTRAAMTPAEAAGLFAVLPLLQSQQAQVGCKGQLLGPISLAAQLTDEAQNPLISDSVLFEGLVQHLCQRARWQAELLQRTNRPVLLCLDEPFIDVISSPFLSIDQDELWMGLARVLDAIPVLRGLAISSDVPLAPLCELPIRVLMVNSSDYAHRIIDAAASIHAFMQRGGILACGCVPVANAGMRAAHALAGMHVLLAQLHQAGIEYALMREQVMIMPVSSLGQTTVEIAEEVIAVTCEVAHALNQALFSEY
ncbi:MAG: hypothetical protein ACK45X_16390 [Roseiflexaceae bacterium]|jgi:hypothetical protein|nr:hypothetical protein [Chloroflexaceae bacterium]